jgi:8-oxo-dGTP pyrophosphatase MutT (NUDIX family)
LVERSSGLTVLLTRRTEHLRDHPGQISFPGGRVEPGDAGPLATALREASEELGLLTDWIEVAGFLPPHAVVTGFVVTPVVGFLQADLALKLDAEEVAEAFEVPLQFFLEPGNLRQSIRRVRDVEVPLLEFSYGGHRIWGATANILSSLIEIL